MKSLRKIVCICYMMLVAFVTVCAQQNIKFTKHVISTTFIAEGVAVGDVNNDGKIDILTGNYWFEAPLWQKHLLHTDTLNPVPGYSTTFLNYCMDANNDGWNDLIRFDQPGGICIWYENPKQNALWKSHVILQTAGIETPLFTDVDGDGRMDLICNDITAKQVVWMKSPAGKNDTAWQRYIISDDSVRATNRYTHGLGFGDINKDGRKDVIIRQGWWEAPADVITRNWKFHAANFGDDCANMYAYDVDEDGDMDVLSSSAHQYGIWWHEQKNDTTFVTHEISKLFSQSHCLMFADINNDGHPDLITGKRYLAHQDAHDPGSFEPSVLYWFEFKPGKIPQWLPHEIDNNSGIGNSFAIKDMNGDGLLDIITSNKKGVFYFEQVR